MHPWNYFNKMIIYLLKFHIELRNFCLCVNGCIFDAGCRKSRIPLTIWREIINFSAFRDVYMPDYGHAVAMETLRTVALSGRLRLLVEITVRVIHRPLVALQNFCRFPRTVDLCFRTRYHLYWLLICSGQGGAYEWNNWYLASNKQ